MEVLFGTRVQVEKIAERNCDIDSSKSLNSCLGLGFLFGEFSFGRKVANHGLT
jgi:hypothetical protein